jgi:hypothetical protein
VTGGNAGDREGKADGNMRGVSVGSETDFAPGENLEAAQGRVSARFPCFPNPLGGLSGVDVACPFHTEATVNLMTPMHAIATNKPIKARADRFGRGNGFDQNPYLDHIASLPVIGGGFKARGNDHTVAIFVDDVSVAHRAPPLITVNRKLWPVVSLGPVL